MKASPMATAYPDQLEWPILWGWWAESRVYGASGMREEKEAAGEIPDRSSRDAHAPFA